MDFIYKYIHKITIVWIIIPYDMLCNNICLFLLYQENTKLYNLLCFNCHRLTSNQCFFPNLNTRKVTTNHDNNNRDRCNHNQITKEDDDIRDRNVDIYIPPNNHLLGVPQLKIQNIPSQSGSNSTPSSADKLSQSRNSGMIKRPISECKNPQNAPPKFENSNNKYNYTSFNNNDIYNHNLRPPDDDHDDDNDGVDNISPFHKFNAHPHINTNPNIPQVPIAFGNKFVSVKDRQNAAMKFYRFNQSTLHQNQLNINGISTFHPLQFGVTLNYEQPKSNDVVLYDENMAVNDTSILNTQSSPFLPQMKQCSINTQNTSKTKTKSDPSYLQKMAQNIPLPQSYHSQTMSHYDTVTTKQGGNNDNHNSLTFSTSNIIKAIVSGVDGKPTRINNDCIR